MHEQNTPSSDPPDNRAQNSDRYIWRTGLKMRSSQYAAPRQDADAGRGSRSSAPRVDNYPRSSWHRCVYKPI
jgi:hypothetical protein